MGHTQGRDLPSISGEESISGGSERRNGKNGWADSRELAQPWPSRRRSYSNLLPSDARFPDLSLQRESRRRLPSLLGLLS